MGWQPETQPKGKPPVEKTKGEGKMQRLIDADALKEYIDCGHLRNPCEVCFSELDVVNMLDKCPTIDAVPKEKILLFLNIANEQLSKAHANKSVNGIMTWSASVTTLEGLLEEYDTADTDIVPVIRCKDCKYGVYETYGEYGHYCCHDQYIETGEEFCAWAEPKATTDEVRKQLKDMEQRREMDRKK